MLNSSVPLASLRATLDELSQRLLNPVAVQPLPSEPIRQSAPIGQVFMWGGRFHSVPQDFRWPRRINTQAMWLLWFFGDASQNIGSYKNISVQFDLSTTACKTQRCRCGKVMEWLIKSAIDGGKIANAAEIVFENQGPVFDYAYNALVVYIYPEIGEKRTGDLTCGVIYQNMIKVKGNAIIEEGVDVAGGNVGMEGVDVVATEV
jgi:hypothetical protein